jgi:hypothetical protein
MSSWREGLGEGEDGGFREEKDAFLIWRIDGLSYMTFEMIQERLIRDSKSYSISYPSTERRR